MKCDSDDIRKIIHRLYHCDFKGRLQIEKDGNSYSLIIGIPSNSRPSFINVQGTYEDFLRYVEKDLMDNSRLWIDYTTVNLTNDD